MIKLEQLQKQIVLSDAYNNYAEKLNMHAFFKLNDHTIGEDLVQDTFMKTWKYLIKGGKIDMMKSFLYHILNNLIIDEYRKHKACSLDTLLESGFEPGEDETSSLFNMLDSKAVILLIKKLPLKYREVMLMKYKQDLSLSEMSSITGCTKNSLAVQISRGLEKLKVLYAHAI